MHVEHHTHSTVFPGLTAASPEPPDMNTATQITQILITGHMWNLLHECTFI